MLFGGLTDFILDPIVELATDLIGELGLWGIFVLMLLDSACVPTSSEAIMLFAGFNVAEGKLGFIEIVVAGVAGNVVGSWLAYAAGYYGRLELLERHHVFHMSPKYLGWADDWFARHGDATVFFTRMMPIIRTFISLPAGVARMPFWRFSVLTTAGCIPWVLGLAYVGQEVGDRWEEWKDRLHYLDYVVALAALVLIVYLVVKRRRNGREPAGEWNRA